MHRGPSSIPLCIQHHIQLTSLSFQVSRPSHSSVTAISIFYLENPRSRSWVSSKFEVTMWVWHSIDSHLFCSMSIGHPVPEIRLFSKFDLENPRSRSWLKSKLKVTKWVWHAIDSHPFRSMSMGLPIPEIQHFQNLTLKIQCQGHGWSGHWKSQHGSNILSTHIPLIPCQSTIPFLRCNFFKIWPWKYKVKVMGEGNIESRLVGVTTYRLTRYSFHVNQPFHSWDTAFSKFDLENLRSRSNDHDGAQLQV